MKWNPGGRLNIKLVFSGMVISMLKIRRSLDRLIFNMGILIPGKTIFILRRGPGLLLHQGGWLARGNITSLAVIRNSSTYVYKHHVQFFLLVLNE